MEQIEKTRKHNLRKRVSLVVVFGLLTAFTFAIHLRGTGKLSTTGRKVSELESRVRVLQEENKKLTLELSKIKNIANIEEYSVAKSMVKVDKIEYINTASNMAMK